MIKRIAITGPESTGKSQLAMQLARHFKTVWVPEFARSYLDDLENKYEYKDLIIIGENQLNRENSFAKDANNFLFCDTDFTVLKIWSEDKFHQCDPWITDKYKTHIYDLYLLMDIDLQWSYDKQREDPKRRQYLFNWFKKELINLDVNLKIIRGNGDERLNSAIKHIQNLEIKK